MSRSTNAQRPYVYEALGSYISVVNNSIHIITPYWSKFINYLHQKIDLLIKDEFYPINTSNCEPIGFQTILCTPWDKDYIRTLLQKIVITSYHACIILHLHKTHEWFRVWSIIEH